MTNEIVASDIREFILAHIDSIAQLEALLLLRENPDDVWNAAGAARRLYISEAECGAILAHLCDRGLLSCTDGTYRYAGLSVETTKMVERLADAYARHLIPVTNIIHRKPHRVQAFADAFKLKKET